MSEPAQVLYGIHDEGKTRFEKYIILAWQWGSNTVPTPVTLGHLPTIKPTSDLFQAAEVLGYLIEGLAFDLDGCRVTQVKLEKEFGEYVQMLKADWQKSAKVVMLNE